MHAYLIMAHKNVNQITTLLKLLDYCDNDIYIHIDKKSNEETKNYDFSKICRKSKVYQYSVINLRWGNISQIHCELFLMRKAHENKKYEFYHLLSGMDLPLKNQKYIHDFFDKNDGKEFVNFSGKQKTAEMLINDRVRYYWGTRWYNLIPYKFSMQIMRKLDFFSIRIQKVLRIDRIRKRNINLYHGAQWVSLTDDFIVDLLKNEKNIYDQYKASYCSDEVFVQTFIMDHKKWFDRLYIPKIENGFESIVRKIDWERGGPYTWHKEDFEELVNSDFLFARKFDENVDSEIIDMIYDYIVGGSENDKNER